MNETAYLSAVMVDHGVLDAYPLGPEHFTGARREVFRAMRRLHDKGLPFDTIILSTEAPSAWPSCMKDVCSSYGVPSIAGTYAEKLKRELERRAIAHIRNVVDEGLEAGKESAEIKAEVEKVLSWSSSSTGAVHAKDIVKGAISIMERGRGLSSGYKGIDNTFLGFQPGDLIILAARPGMGKSALAGGIAGFHGKQKHKVLIFSLEMTKEQWICRLACSVAGVSYQDIVNKKATSRQYSELVAAMADVSTWDIVIEETPGISISELRSTVRREKPVITIVDYLQLVTSKQESRHQEISEISRQLKACAKESHTTVLALSQLNRAVESRSDKRPTLSDLRESGQIEQDADCIMFIYREAVYCERCKTGDCRDPHRTAAEVEIAKQRNGPTGVAFLSWIGEQMKFGDREDRR